MFIYELIGYRIEFRCSLLNFRYHTSFHQGVLWHLGKYRWWIQSEMRIYMTRTYSQMHRTDNYSKHSSIIWPVRSKGWAFFYETSDCGFQFCCVHLNFRFCTFFKEGVLWHSGEYKFLIHSKMRTDMTKTYR